MVRIVFMGTPDFAVPSLKTLIEKYQVAGVVTQPDRPAGRGRKLRPSPVKRVAESAGIPVYQPKSLKDEASAGPLLDWHPDIIIVAAFGQILKDHVLSLPPKGCLNVHASLLPRWRGASPIQHAIMAGDAATGVSLMQMDAGLDTGPVYVQEAISIGPEETGASLHDRLAVLGAKLLDEHLAAILSGRLSPEPQDNESATYAPQIKKQDGAIDWQQSSRQIERKIRAMSPWPSTFTTWQGKSLKILAARDYEAKNLPDKAPGEVIEPAKRTQDGQMEQSRDVPTAVVLTGDGGLELLRIQLAGKKSMSIESFLRGHPDLIGSRLGN